MPMKAMAKMHRILATRRIVDAKRDDLFLGASMPTSFIEKIRGCFSSVVAD
jgi:hypothetical protein